MMGDLIERYATDKEYMERFYNVPYSRVAEERLDRFLADWQGQLETVDFGRLDQAGRVDYVLLRNHLETSRRRIQHEARRRADLVATAPVVGAIAELEASRRRMAGPSAEEAGRRLAQIAEDAENLARSLKPEGESASRQFSPVQAQRLEGALGRSIETLERWHAHYAHYQPEYAWWLREPHQRLLKAFRQAEKRCTKAKGEEDVLVGEPIGREALEDAIRGEMIPYSPEELIEIGEAQLEWCTARMAEASRELGCGDDWKAALEKVKASHVPLGQQHRVVEDLAREAIAYVENHDLVTVEDLCREAWYVDMISKKDQKKLPFLAYGGQRILVSYPTHDMDRTASEMSVRANNVHFTRAVTHHELIPGHHLQIYMGERYRRYRRVFHTPFLSEGWCLHWEMLLWDRGFARGPEDRVGMLFWRMHRCARISVSLRFHLGEMTPEEMADTLVERVGHERDAARSEVRRYIGPDYGPLYQCSYMIGALQLQALYRELVTQGGMTDREFHDAVLRENAIPIEMIRASLTGAPLTPDYQSQWRFATTARR